MGGTFFIIRHIKKYGVGWSIPPGPVQDVPSEAAGLLLEQYKSTLKSLIKQIFFSENKFFYCGSFYYL